MTVTGEAVRLNDTMTKIADEYHARFAAGLRSRRAHLDLTQEEVARRAGINRSYLSDLERGRGKASVGMAGELAVALETTVGELLGEPATGVGE